MFKYIQEIIDESPEEFVGKAEAPAATHLFEVDDEKKPINEDKSRLYHRLTAKLLYLCKRAPPDMQTAVSFLCTRVKAPTEDDWKKLGRAIRYLRSSKWLPLTLEAEQTMNIKWWVDA